MKRIIEIKFKENDKIFFDSAIIEKDITEEQAQQLVKMGIARIVDAEDKKN